MLEGQAALTADDIETSLADAAARAEDLQAEMTSLLTAAHDADDWKARERVLGWVEDAFKRAKGITKELRSHLSLVEVRVEAGVLEVLVFLLFSMGDRDATGAENMAGLLRWPDF